MMALEINGTNAHVCPLCGAVFARRHGNTYSLIADLKGAQGVKERADYEMTRVVENILDPNTSATAARKITITLTLKSDDTRQNIAVSCVAKSTLAATNPVTTSLYVADEESIVEMVPQIPGQLAVDAGEQEAPPMLKLIHTA